MENTITYGAVALILTSAGLVYKTIRGQKADFEKSMEKVEDHLDQVATKMTDAVANLNSSLTEITHSIDSLELKMSENYINDKDFEKHTLSDQKMHDDIWLELRELRARQDALIEKINKSS
jgi:DNA anti-recombination protein RmuC